MFTVTSSTHDVTTCADCEHARLGAQGTARATGSTGASYTVLRSNGDDHCVTVTRTP